MGPVDHSHLCRESVPKRVRLAALACFSLLNRTPTRIYLFSAFSRRCGAWYLNFDPTV